MVNMGKLRPNYFPKAILKSGGAQMFRPNVAGSLNVQIIITGLNVVSMHAQAADALIPGALGILAMVTGRYTTFMAQKSIVQMGAVDTGLTLRSIHPELETTPTMTKVSIGPSTYYAPLIEFGLGPHFPYGPRPFMSEAFSLIVPGWLRALHQLAMVVAGPSKTIKESPYAREVNSWLRGFRGFLYDTEKRIGDVVPLGAPTFLNKLRQGMINLARSIGDVQSVVGHVVGARIFRRLEGKVTGRLIGIGSHTIFATHNIATKISGAERAYNRIAGKYTSKFISQNQSFGGFGG
jgi:hypothetical protein